MEVTLLTENTRVRYTGDGVLKEFSYPFNPIDLSYVKVYKNLQPVTAPDVTISSGVVTFNTAPAEGDSIVIIREKPLTYDSGIVSKGIISPDSLDNLAVELLGQIQQVNEKLDRVPVYPIDTTMTGEEILNQFNQDVQTVKDSRVEVEGKAEEINNTVSSGLTEINNTTSESKSQITEEKNTSISEIQRVTEGLINRAEVAADESKSWADKAESFANQANLDSIRTNCLTAIPQDIKLELNNGTLTLKAGSKVYVPNGPGVFDEVTINSDSSVTANANIPLMLFIDTSTNKLTYEGIISCFSGNTAPTSVQIMTWYDTQENKVKRSMDKGATWTSYRSLPIGIANCDTDKITSIDQVFNGFGYIGSHWYEIKGNEGKARNGRNVDGSLNNSTRTTVNVMVHTCGDGTGEWFLMSDFNGGFRNAAKNTYFIQDEMPSASSYTGNYAVWESPSENIIRITSNKGETWAKVLLVNCGNYSTDSTGRITSFNPKTTFNAADYYDTVRINDAQAITGRKTFTATPISNGELWLVDTTGKAPDNPPSQNTAYGTLRWIVKGTKGSTAVYGGGQELWRLQPILYPADNFFRVFNLYRYGGANTTLFSFGCDKNGNNAFFSVPTPALVENSNLAATTAWVRKVAALTDLSNTTLMANRAIITDRNGRVSISTTVTSTELGYLEGVTSAIQTQLNAKANLASPAFSGTPTAPTQASTDNSTRIATTAFVNSRITNMSSTVGSRYVYINNLLIQWGPIGRTTTNGTIWVGFPKPFANTAYGLSLSEKADDGERNGNRKLTVNKTLSTTGFKVTNDGWTDAYNGITGSWIAIGQRG